MMIEMLMLQSVIVTVCPGPKSSSLEWDGEKKNLFQVLWFSIKKKKKKQEICWNKDGSKN